MGLLFGFVLIAIAIPTFLGARARAQDRFVQSNLRNATTAALTIVADSGSYREITGERLREAEPDLTYVDATTESSSPSVISVMAGDDQVVAAARSASGRCFFIAHAGDQTAYATNKPSTACIAAAVSNVQLRDGW